MTIRREDTGPFSADAAFAIQGDAPDAGSLQNLLRCAESDVRAAAAEVALRTQTLERAAQAAAEGRFMGAASLRTETALLATARSRLGLAEALLATLRSR